MRVLGVLSVARAHDQWHRIMRCASNTVTDHYQVLGVPSTSKPAQIKLAYYELSKKYHPDSGGADADSARFHLVAAAYDVLGNANKRKVYDEQRQARVTGAPVSRPGTAQYNTHYDNRPFTKEQYARDFDFDYRSFVDFQSRMRDRQNYRSVRMAYVPQDVWDDLNVQQHDVLNKHTSAFYRGQRATTDKRKATLYTDEDDLFIHQAQYRTGDNTQHADKVKGAHTVPDQETLLRQRRRAAMPTFEQFSRDKQKRASERRRLQGASLAVGMLCASMLTLLVQAHQQHRTSKHKTTANATDAPD